MVVSTRLGLAPGETADHRAYAALAAALQVFQRGRKIPGLMDEAGDDGRVAFCVNVAPVPSLY